MLPKYHLPCHLHSSFPSINLYRWRILIWKVKIFHTIFVASFQAEKPHNFPFLPPSIFLAHTNFTQFSPPLCRRSNLKRFFITIFETSGNCCCMACLISFFFLHFFSVSEITAALLHDTQHITLFSSRFCQKAERKANSIL